MTEVSHWAEQNQRSADAPSGSNYDQSQNQKNSTIALQPNTSLTNMEGQQRLQGMPKVSARNSPDNASATKSDYEAYINE
jgi:hypothetical protein